MSKTEKRLSYKAGITRTPSDFLCQDGELAECINLVTDHEELKVAVQPEAMFGGESKNRIFYVHEGSTFKNHITIGSYRGQNVLSWFDEENDTGGFVDYHFIGSDILDKLMFKHIGNILIVCNGEEMRYHRWMPSSKSYADLGTKIPEPEVEFMLAGSYQTFKSCGSDKIANSIIMEEASRRGSDKYHTVRVKDGQQEAYNNLVVGLYAETLKGIAENKMFARPFAVRYALELYDGSYTHISGPIMLFPAITCNCNAMFSSTNNDLRVDVMASKLYFKANFNYEEWADIVRGVVVFSSQEVSLYETGGDQSPSTNGAFSDEDPIYVDYISSHSTNERQSLYDSIILSTGFWSYVYFLPLNPRDSKDILEDLALSGNFYKLFEIGTKGNGAWENSQGYIRSHTIENLTTQEQLAGGDYYSHCQLIPNVIMRYNSRLTLADVRRGFFEGFTSFLAYDNAESHAIDMYVFINTPSGEKLVCKNYNTKEKVGWYFYYPDPRAYRAVAFQDGEWLCTMELKEHPYLNGAYYFEELPGDADAKPSSTNGTQYLKSYLASLLSDEGGTYTEPEYLTNQVFTSEVNNPFVFTAQGNKTIGTGKIVALATLTTALSQGQFGQHPVIVFTSEGIWAMSVDSEGYMNPAQPMSREVCINAKSVIETDGAVYFASKKGLMMLQGNQVRCVSGQMNGVKTIDTSLMGGGGEWNNIVGYCSYGNSFLSFIRDKSCFMAYDYIDSRILIINPGYNYVYAYGMADGTISKVVLDNVMVRAVQSYPDCLLQNNAGVVFSLYNKKDESEVTSRVLGFLLTRPMKIGGPTGVVSLRELVNVGMWSKQGGPGGSVVKTQVWVSDDLETWHPIRSRFGAAAKYFRIGLYVRMLPSERLSGTVLQVQQRRSDNAR